MKRTIVASLALLLALLATYQTPQAQGSNNLKFFTGFSLALPAAVCAKRSHGPDYWQYEFYEAGHAAAPILRLYVGSAPSFPLSRRATDPPRSAAAPKPLCDGVRFSITTQGDLSIIAAGCERSGGNCREVLIKHLHQDGSVTSDCLHFWYGPISKEDAALADAIIASVQASLPLSDDPPLKIRCP